MKTLIASIVFATISSYAFGHNGTPQNSWDDPNESFNATAPRIHQGPINIEWRLADNINNACEQASRSFGNKGFGGREMQGCAFWWGKKCVIITKKNPTMHTVGHEMRHCFYGEWHPGKGH